ncbi:MAG: hypothetical protein EXR49_09220 [Dehalococcoidia bacterium]|nr:hypothetical protein [Dehalococcoidia bacterium]
MRIVAVMALAAMLALTACKQQSSTPAAQVRAGDLQEIYLQGAATADGVLTLSQPAKIQIKVSRGHTALETILAVRAQLQERGYEVTCTLDHGNGGYSLLTPARLEVASKDSNLGGIAGLASQVIQRRQTVESTVREYYRSLRQNDIGVLQRNTTPEFYASASKRLGENVELVQMGVPALGCHTSSVVVETALAGGDHQQHEVQLALQPGSLIDWRINASNQLASWKAQQQPSSR